MPSSREELIDYCLRELGAPVLEINLDSDQISDRIDDAFQFYQEYHTDAIERIYLKHQVTSSNIINSYIELPDTIVGVVRVLPFTGTTGSAGDSYMWDIQYQLRLNDMYNLMSASIIYYNQVKSHLALLDQLLSGNKSIRFKRHTNRLEIDMNWSVDITEGEYILIEAYRILDPDTYTDVYNDRWLKRYATALIKKQWGNNLKKFEGVQMPGGVTLNGQTIFNEALIEIDELENLMMDMYVEPPSFTVG